MDPINTVVFGATAGAIVLYRYMKRIDFETTNASYFKPTKTLGMKDSLIVSMLEHNEGGNGGDGKACWIITDPELADNPIIFSSDGFCKFTGYKKREIEGSNCRFLQGTGTRKEDIDIIRKAIKEEKECSVCLLNYRKDGTPFMNQFFMTPLYDDEGNLAYFLGVQAAVESRKEKQEGENPGWRIYKWL